MKILGTGLTGLLGSRIVNVLQNKYTFENISTSTGVDITDKEKIVDVITSSEASIVLHLAAKTDVDGCEKDKELQEESDAWKINVEGTRNIAFACKQSGKKLLYVSTDFVFDGEKEAGDYYRENDTPNPINWYGITKYNGEQSVQELESYVIIRLAYPYGNVNSPKKDFVRAILSRLETDQPVQGVTDHIFCPTFIDNIVHVFEKLIDVEAEGIFHAVGSEALTPYDAALLIATEFGYNTDKIGKVTREEFFRGRAQRPFNLALSNDKIQQLGISMDTFAQGIKKLKTQLNK